MDDATFLRNLAAHGRLALLADGTAVPSPVTVMDDESRAGSPFLINLVSPEGAESGDGRTFEAGTITWRDLPLPLMWQWQLDDGHKGAVIVGRIDYIEETPKGLGNARGVFDNGPWGREAERLVREKMLRGVSGDYSNFKAEPIEEPQQEAAEGEDTKDILDKLKQNPFEEQKINVTQSKLVAATLVSKPAFEGCYIQITDESGNAPEGEELAGDPDAQEYPDGVIEAAAPITAAALTAAGLNAVVERLERLEMLEMQLAEEELSLTASAVRERVEKHRLTRARQEAIERINRNRSLTADGSPPLSHDFLSNKATNQPRDRNGKFLEMGAMVRWPRDGVKGRGYERGRVKNYDQAHRLYQVEDLHSGQNVNLPGQIMEAVKAVIPSSPEQGKRINSIHPEGATAA